MLGICEERNISGMIPRNISGKIPGIFEERNFSGIFKNKIFREYLRKGKFGEYF